jgi:hypothetical protein
MRTFSWIAVIMTCFVSGGATCMRRNVPTPYPPPPPILTETPDLQAVLGAVNRTANIRQLSSNSASVDVLSMPRVPKLNATLALEREKRFRLRASLPIVLGAGLDMGSNDQVFWFEVPEGMSQTLYYAEHEKYRQQIERAILPIDPSWLMDALGLVQIDPSTVVAGPVTRPDGKLEIRSTLTMPHGVYQKVCFIEHPAGHVTEQFLYSPGGALVATSQATNHRYYDEAQCALPHQVTVNLTPAAGPPLSLRIDIGSYTLNQLISGDPNQFSMPQSAGKAIDLTTITGFAPQANAGVVPANYAAGGSTPLPMRGMIR